MKSRYLAFLLFALLVIQATCGFASAEAATDNSLPLWLQPYEETVTLTTGKNVIANMGFLDPTESQGNNVLLDAVLETLNIDIELAWESDNYYTKLSLQMASDDLPDFFMIEPSQYRLYRQMIDNGCLADLSEYFPKYAAETLWANVESCDSLSVKALTEPDGSLYAIGNTVSLYNGTPLLWLRNDWLKELQMEPPKTIEELEAVLVAFRDNYGSIGLITTGENAFGGYGSMYSLWPIFGAFNAYPSMWVKQEDGQTVYGTTMNTMKDALTLLQRWYAEGLIAKEFPTYDMETCAAKYVSGETGSAFAPWHLPYNINAMVESGGGDLVIVNAPLDASGVYNVPTGAPYGKMMCVSAKCAHPEAVVKVLSFETECYGYKIPQYYDIIKAERDNGVSQEAMAATDGLNFAPAGNLLKHREAALERLSNNGEVPDEEKYAGGTWLKSSKFVYDYINGTDTSANAWLYYMGYFQASELFEAEEVNNIQPAFSVATEHMEDFWADLQTLTDTTLLSIVIGEKPVSAFDEFVEQWYTEGGEVITEEVNASVG